MDTRMCTFAMSPTWWQQNDMSPPVKHRLGILGWLSYEVLGILSCRKCISPTNRREKDRGEIGSAWRSVVSVCMTRPMVSHWENRWFPVEMFPPIRGRWLDDWKSVPSGDVKLLRDQQDRPGEWSGETSPGVLPPKGTAFYPHAYESCQRYTSLPRKMWIVPTKIGTGHKSGDFAKTSGQIMATSLDVPNFWCVNYCNVPR